MGRGHIVDVPQRVQYKLAVMVHRVVWDGEPRRTSPITACRSPRFVVASICDPPVAVNPSFQASVAALSVLVLSPLRAQQFGILCLAVCVIQLLGLISFDVT